MKTKDLKAILSKSKKFLGDAVPIAGCLVLSPEGYSIDNGVDTIRWKGKCNASGAILHSELSSFLKNIDNKEEIEFSNVLPENDRIELQINGESIARFENHLKTEADRLEPIEFDTGGEPLFTVEKADYPAIQSAMKFVLPNDIIRENMRCVQLSTYITATNGNQLFFQRAQSSTKKFVPVINEKNSDNTGEVKIPFDYLKLVIETEKSGFGVYVAQPVLKTRVIALKGENLCVFIQDFRNRFPDWINVMPLHDSLHTNLVADRKEMLKWLKVASGIVAKDAPNVTLAWNNGELTIGAVNEETGNVFEKKIPVKTSQPKGPDEEIPAHITYNIKLLIASIGESQQEQFTLRTFGPSRGSIIDKNILQMPVISI